MSLDLKELKLSHERIKTGRLFQSSGAETAKARGGFWKVGSTLPNLSVIDQVFIQSDQQKRHLFTKYI